MGEDGDEVGVSRKIHSGLAGCVVKLGVGMAGQSLRLTSTYRHFSLHFPPAVLAFRG